MPLGMQANINWSIDLAQNITNATDYPNLALQINHLMFGGYLYFMLMVVLFLIILVPLIQTDNEIFPNIMIASGVVSIVSFLLRAIFGVINGTELALLSDAQMWVFPAILVISTLISYANRTQ